MLVVFYANEINSHWEWFYRHTKRSQIPGHNLQIMKICKWVEGKYKSKDAFVLCNNSNTTAVLIQISTHECRI